MKCVDISMKDREWGDGTLTLVPVGEMVQKGGKG